MVLYGGENCTKSRIKWIFNAQGTAEILAIEDILDKDSSEDDPPTAGEPTEPPDVDTLSKLCGYPRALAAGDIFRTQSKSRSGNKILDA